MTSDSSDHLNQQCSVSMSQLTFFPLHCTIVSPILEQVTFHAEFADVLKKAAQSLYAEEGYGSNGTAVSRIINTCIELSFSVSTRTGSVYVFRRASSPVSGIGPLSGD